MKRGDLIVVVTSGDYGKPRPAVILQSDAYSELSSITVLPLTTELHETPTLRITLEPGDDTGLQRRSQVMVDKMTTVPRSKAGQRIGRLAAVELAAVTQAVTAFLGLG